VLSAALDVPLLPTDHQAGHIRAGIFSTGIDSSQPFIAVHTSGGTFELLHISSSGYKIVAATSDISAGQFVDRVGVALGLNFPAGPELEKLALSYTGHEVPITFSCDGCYCSFSGPESAALRMIGDYSPECIAYSVFMCVSKVLAKLISCSAKKLSLTQVLLVGGVAGSSFIKAVLLDLLKDTGITACFCSPTYSSDNAVGVALIGRDRLMSTNKND
ncbi:MAG TPA: O-sialoglycoprotein endopeptidase, partial [Clostridia bacterium]|nr:O-sialoglycoprotein endopeptidase [Clostridia bacterium]